jgi:hypothetical protein
VLGNVCDVGKAYIGCCVGRLFVVEYVVLLFDVWLVVITLMFDVCDCDTGIGSGSSLVTIGIESPFLDVEGNITLGNTNGNPGCMVYYKLYHFAFELIVILYIL